MQSLPEPRIPPPEKLVERAFDAFSRRDAEAFLELVHPNVEIMLPTAEIAREGRPYVGVEGVQEYFDDVATHYEELRVIPQLLATRGDVIVVVGRAYARGDLGITDTPAGWVVHHSDGRMSSLRVYSNRQEAMRAGGVVESQLRALNKTPRDA